MRCRGLGTGAVALLCVTIFAKGVQCASLGDEELASRNADVAALPVLRVGEVVDGKIVRSDSLIETATLERDYAGSVVRGRSFRIEVPTSGPCYIDLRSHLFDSYLVLRDGSGAVIAENDDGWIAKHARLTVSSLDADASYSVDACALHGGEGTFELRLTVGKPEALTVDERGALELREAREAARVVEATKGPDDLDTVAALDNLALRLYQHGDLGAARSLIERTLAALESRFGEDDPRTVQHLANLAQILRRQREFAAARPLYERVLAIHEATSGLDHPSTAVSLQNLAACFQEQGDLDAARPLFERALAVREKVYGPEHPFVAWSLNDLATLLQAQGDFAEAEPLFERALRIAETALGSDHPETASLLNNLASLLKVQGDFEAARVYLERVVSIDERAALPDPRDVARSLNHLADVLRIQGEYEGALELHRRALSALEDVSAPAPVDIGETLNGLGLVHLDLGDLAAARPLLERALSIHEAALGTAHPNACKIRNNLAGLLAELGDYGAARSLFERSLSISEATLGADHPEVASTLNSLAVVAVHLGDSDRARALVERAYSIHEDTLGADHPRAAGSLTTLAGILQDQGDFEASRSLYERVLLIHESRSGPDHPETAACLANLAVALMFGGELEGARPLLERALSIREERLGPNHPETVGALNNLALLMLDLGDRVEARELSARALEAAEGRRMRLAWSLTESERLLFARRQWFTLRTYLSASIRQREKADVMNQPYQRLLAWKAQVFRSMSQSRGSALADLSQADRERADRLREIQRQLSRGLYDKGVDDRAAHEQRLASLRDQRKALELEMARSLGPRAEGVVPSVADLAGALPERSVLVDFLVHKVYRPASWDDQGNLIAGGVWRRDRLSAWVLRSGSDVVQYIDLGEATPIEAATRSFLDGLVATRGVHELLPPGSDRPERKNDTLRRLLWKPLAPYIGSAERVFVSPDGFLGTLPLEVVQLEDESYLLEHHAFVYLESASSLVDAAVANASDVPSLLSVGNVDYRKPADLAWRQAKPAAGALPTDSENDSASQVAANEYDDHEGASPGPTHNLLARADVRGGFLNRWYSLPATEGEARAVTEMHEDEFEEAGRRLTLTARDATEERLKHELPRYNIVHLATHGFFQPEGLPSMWKQVMDDDGKRRMEMFEEEKQIVGLMPGLLSGLVLAGANRAPGSDRDDGLLTAEEISLLDLSGVDLVVLSACETALGKSEAGEGMLGLRRMFRQAGAKSVISSLWSVKDDSTSLLMQNFYDRRWIRGQGTLEALRGAQLDLLKQNRIENDGAGLPSTWGAFVLDGAWR